MLEQNFHLIELFRVPNEILEPNFFGVLFLRPALRGRDDPEKVEAVLGQSPGLVEADAVETAGHVDGSRRDAVDAALLQPVLEGTTRLC